MRTALRPLCLSALVVVLAAPAHAASLKSLAKKLGRGLKGEENKKVAVLNFPYPGGALSSGSTIVQERLTTHLAEAGKLDIIERNRLDAVLAEMKLEKSGVIDEKTTHEIGRVLGVAALVTGTLNDLPEGRAEVNARLIHAQTGKVLAAGMAEIERTWKDVPVLAGGGAAPQPPKPSAPTQPGTTRGKPLVQLAILLDTSNSMDGLISQAKSQLWKIVNGLASAEKGGNNPELQVALYEYGNDNLSSGEGFIRQVLPFISDLDKISEALFGLKTNGGQEYCGQVLRDSVLGLGWAPESDVYKAVFIAGNEPFTQGPVDFREAVAQAKAKGIFINTIYCGSRQSGIATQWKDGADLGGGEYMNIDQEREVVAIRAPQDDEIERLGRELNRTFIPYGRLGVKAEERQMQQDSAAAAVRGGAAVQRALFKAKKQYSESASWDAATLVEGGKRVSDLDAAQLPEELRTLSLKEREGAIQEKLRKRKDIQAKIEQLNRERQAYVAEQERAQTAASPAEMSLDQAIMAPMHKQAEASGFRFEQH
ncbi:MAG: FlgO family outer membrane protein [Elusimicrobiota bacterium]